MTRHSPPKPQPTEEGATLIVTVLSVTVLVAVLVAVSTQMSLTSRTGSFENRDTLRAQYAAESGLATAQHHLNDIQMIFGMEKKGVPSSLVVPTNTRTADMLTWASDYCKSTWTKTSPNGTYPEKFQCVAAGTSSADTKTRYEIMARFLDLNKLPASNVVRDLATANGSTMTLNDMRDFWLKIFTSGVGVERVLGNDKYTTSYKLRPLKVERTGITKYRIYFTVDGVRSSGVSGGATRVVNANSTANTDYWFEIAMPGFTDKVLFTNKHRNKAGSIVNFVEQDFDGPVHTNESFAFATTASSQFSGKVTSAGCYEYEVVNGIPKDCKTNSDGTYKTQPNVIVGTNRATLGTPLLNMPNINDYGVSSMTALKGIIPSAVNFAQGIDLAAPYQAMPENANDQKAAAQADGLVIPNGATVTLAASTSATSVVAPTTYNATDEKWTPEATYQFITVKAGATTTTYRLSPSGLLQKQTVAGGPWTTERTNFNGVLYSAGDNSTTSTNGTIRLRGPARPTATGKAPPAMAGFAQITVAAEDNIFLDNDLTYSDVPCKEPKPCASKTTPRNLLGIYAQNGNVTISTLAPKNLNIHAVTMSSYGEVHVANHNDTNVGDRGDVTMLGGMIENYYGAFGTFSTSTGVRNAGYGRKFSFDERMGEGIGMSPPFFPVSPNWVVADGSSKDKYLTSLTWQQGKKQ